MNPKPRDWVREIVRSLIQVGFLILAYYAGQHHWLG